MVDQGSAGPVSSLTCGATDHTTTCSWGDGPFGWGQDPLNDTWQEMA